MAKLRQYHIGKILTYVGIVIVVFWCLFPLYWMVNTAVKPRAEIITTPPRFLPSRMSDESYNFALKYLIVPGIVNSLVIASVSTVFVIFLGSLTAFGFSRLKFKGRENMLFWILSLRMFPTIVVVIPLFLLLQSLKLVDTRSGMIFVYIGFNLPFTIWIMKTFFDELPQEIEEAAMIDGCSFYMIFIKIALPLAIPGVIAATIFSFIFAWNEFLFALILTRAEAVTAPVVLAALETTGGIFWGRIAAFSSLMVIPVIILCASIQKHIVRGLTFGAVKG